MKNMVPILFFFLVLILGITTSFYFLVGDELLQTTFLIILVVEVLLGIAGMYLEFIAPVQKFKKKWKVINLKIMEESLEVLKDLYLGLFNCYLRMSEGQKEKFYHLLLNLRERMEEQMQLEKKVETLLHQPRLSLASRKKTFDEVYEHFHRLPRKVQQKYYGPLLQLKQELEKGK